MRIAHLRKIDLAVLAGLLLLSIIVVALGARLIQARSATASVLGAGWQCHRLLNVQVCDRSRHSTPVAAPDGFDQRPRIGSEFGKIRQSWDIFAGLRVVNAGGDARWPMHAL